MDTLGSLIRARRETLGLSLRALARKVGRSPAHLSNVEAGHQPPGDAMLAVVLAMLDVPQGDRDRWWAAAGIVPPPLRAALLARPEAWAAVRAALGEVQ